jgi:hypothetical protein
MNPALVQTASRAHLLAIFVIPKAVTQTLLRRLSDCSTLVAHRQFSGE